MPISLSDSQLDIITRHAEPLLPIDRDKYLHRVASLLHGVEIGDGAVNHVLEVGNIRLRLKREQSEFAALLRLIGSYMRYRFAAAIAVSAFSMTCFGVA